MNCRDEARLVPDSAGPTFWGARPTERQGTRSNTRYIVSSGGGGGAEPFLVLLLCRPGSYQPKGEGVCLDCVHYLSPYNRVGGKG
eukprot:scaffold19489_cov110-Isochrysis_galbana.AAC.6